MRWVYSLFLASLAVFAWIEELFKDQVVDYAGRLFFKCRSKLAIKLRSFGAIFSTGGDDKLANVFIQLDG